MYVCIQICIMFIAYDFFPGDVGLQAKLVGGLFFICICYCVC